MPTYEILGVLIAIFVIWVILKLLKVAVRLILFFIVIAVVLGVVYHFMR
jgi:hypothetical protein